MHHTAGLPAKMVQAQPSSHSLASLAETTETLETSDASQAFLPRLSDAKPYNPHDSTTTHGHRLKRYWLRAFVVILAPLVVTAYFVWIWQACLRDESPSRFASHNQLWVFYSWFIIGVFGLNLSKYGLVGAEAAMLQTPMWRAKNLMVLMMHNGSTWSGPGGWMKCAMKLMQRKQVIVGPLWNLLAILSLVSFVALPLSGLAMEPADGFVSSTAPVMAVGYLWERFNYRLEKQNLRNGLPAWRTGMPTILPGIGLLYTPPYLKRSKFSHLDSLPNTLPADEGNPDIFLPPQANYPMGGKAWGLRLGYNCTIVESASEFTILNERSSAHIIGNVLNNENVLQLGTPSNATIYAFKGQASNLWAYVEMGFTLDMNNTRFPGATDPITKIYGYSDPPFPSDASGEFEILEYILWQVRMESSYKDNITMNFNPSVESPIAGLGHLYILDGNGNFTVNETFFDLKRNPRWDNSMNVSESKAKIYPEQSLHTIESLAAPVGVRCSRASALGTAELDVKSSTFDSFQQSPKPPFTYTYSENETPRFGQNAVDILAGRYMDIFTSINAPPPQVYSNSASYSYFLSAAQLRKSIMRAHAVDALQLMYDGLGNMDGAYLHPNLTSSKPGKILIQGAISPIVPAVLLGIWALVSALVGAVYAFRLRWSETLDGYSMFRFGADFADRINGQADFSMTIPFDKCEKLAALPGMIGDSRVQSFPGHVSLVEPGNTINPRKRYT